MVTPQSPFSFLNGFMDRLGSLQPPQWLVDELQHRAVLFLNHVLQQEPEATARLARQKGRVALVQWRQFSLRLLITPAGLLDRAAPGAPADLTLTVTDESPLSLAQAAMRGTKPAVRIEGDVQLAAEINWLVDNVRWDVEEDLSRLIGDVPAHRIGQVARKVAQSLRQFVAQRGGASAAGASAPPPPAGG
ncbi:SCP2 sterol-binding domain-containing protein [uncultured Xylophilus sp.]|uniref:ubiquinone biosynthesis accessory factor UbiJ n=1 Tax=uncultured Xylophilus sp. TaxID=296832 RepID=UPI0025FEF5F0|nr:SCP2 sterol-binding domain-containing protein [uncultured Xylophilus sp.]